LEINYSFVIEKTKLPELAPVLAGWGEEDVGQP
jgi:hypothetical protein